MDKSSYSELNRDQEEFLSKFKNTNTDNPYEWASLALEAIGLELYDIALYISVYYMEMYSMASEDEESYTSLAILFEGLKEATASHIRFS